MVLSAIPYRRISLMENGIPQIAQRNLPSWSSRDLPDNGGSGYDEANILRAAYGDARDPDTFKKEFACDLEQTRFRAVIQTAFLGAYSVRYWSKLLRETVARGRRVCLYIQEPDHWHERDNPNLPSDIQANLSRFQTNLQLLRSFGCHINFREKTHQKYAVFDHRKLWEGSLNILSHRDTDDRMRPFWSRADVIKGIISNGFDYCEECAMQDRCTPISAVEARAQLDKLVAALIARRKSLDLSQRDFAQLLKIHQSTLCQLENGKTRPFADTLIQAGWSLDRDLLWVPRIMVPTVEHLLDERLRLKPGDL
jgi:DNA-binding XRE family transcriptional regulator